MTSIVAAYARQRLADMEELSRDLGRSRDSARRSRPTTTRRTARSWLQRVLRVLPAAPPARPSRRIRSRGLPVAPGR